MNQKKGFTLLEMLLVLVVMGSILALITNYSTQRMDQYRIDRSATQMQQILNAGLAYYTAYGVWPPNGISDLTSKNYLPSNITSPYGTSYSVSNSGSTFSVTVNMPLTRLNDPFVLAGELPMATVTQTSSVNQVTAQVVIPGQNLNNARSVNFASVYHSGACVPVPTCPTGMIAQIVTVPSGVQGVYDAPTQADGVTPCTQSPIYNSATGALINSSADCVNINSYPVTAFTAYATPPSTSSNSGYGYAQSCANAATYEQCYAEAYGSSPSAGGAWAAVSTTNNQAYWRVCLKVQTEKGPVSPTYSSTPPGSGDAPNIFWTQAEGYIFVVTRCTPNTGTGEPSGSSLNVWGY